VTAGHEFSGRVVALGQGAEQVLYIMWKVTAGHEFSGRVVALGQGAEQVHSRDCLTRIKLGMAIRGEEVGT